MSVLKSTAVTQGVMPDLATAGVVLQREGLYVTTARIAASTTIQMVPLPAGAMVRDIQVAISTAFSDPGATVDVGDGGDDNRYFDNLVLKTGSGNSMASRSALGTPAAGTSAAPAWGKTYSTQDTVDFHPESALSTGVTLKCVVEYVMSGSISDET